MDNSSQLILGIDPGSRSTGYGIIWSNGSQQGLVHYGFIRTLSNSVGQRLHEIHQQLCEVIKCYQPQAAAIEQIFTCRNPQSALKLGQARGAALVALANFALPTAEYSARQIKKSVVGYGAAEKFQVQHMVRSLLKMTETPQADAADALAIALCHAYHQNLQTKLAKGIPQ